MSEATDIAIIDLTNTTDRPLRVNLMLRGEARHIITLAPGETTRQVTPSGAAWSFSSEPAESSEPSGSGSEGGGEVDLNPAGGQKGGGRSIG